MVGVRYTGDSLYSRRDGPTWTPEDPVHDVDAGLAEQLVRRDRFERTDPSEGLEPEDTAESESEDADAEADGESEPADTDTPPGEDVCTCDPGEACGSCGGDCPTVKSDGDVCGRDRPCRYHDTEG